MEHETNTSGSFAELPQPQEIGEQATEQGASTPQETQGKQMPTLTPPATQPPVTIPDPQIAAPPLPNATTATPSDPATTGLIADDADLIEKEWVMRAKAIVMHTKDDPHAQNQEMNKVKADYLKKRYNKDLKTSEN
jgi:hypothetical protein